MYTAFLVDDEMPALRFMQNIIEKHLPEYRVVGKGTCAEEALEYLGSHPVDLLMTDISMPGMDGIALSLRVRSLYPDMHIVLVSGYAEFDYARGAIEAAVDDYLLKPISVSHMTETLGRIAEKIQAERAAKIPALLSALLSGQAYNEALADRVYGDTRFYFALIRWGNLGMLPPSRLHATAPVPLADAPFTALSGRDEEEQLLLAPAEGTLNDFCAAVRAYMDARVHTGTWTAVCARSVGPVTALPDFFKRAAQMQERIVVIGKRQLAYLTAAASGEDTPHIANAILKRLEYFMAEANAKMIKNILLSLAADWEKRQVPQRYATAMVQQLVHAALLASPALSNRQDALLRDVADLFPYARSYGDLLTGVYAILFDDSGAQDRKLSARELYEYAVRCVQEQYAQPISIQQVCSEIGISQTYLSRLFRKYGDTSFSAMLTQCRMDNAMALMREHPDVLLRDVAACVGYEDSSYFSKVFHQATGKTPSQFAAEVMEGTRGDAIASPAVHEETIG